MLRYKMFMLALIAFAFSAKAQIKVDTVLMSGYLIYDAFEKHVKQDDRNTRNRLKGKSFYVSDGVKVGKFVQFSDKMSLKSALTHIDRYPQCLYLIDGTGEAILNRYYEKELNIRNASTKFCRERSPYLKIKGVKNKLFRVYVARAKWIHFTIDTSEQKAYNFLKTRVTYAEVTKNTIYDIYLPIEMESYRPYHIIEIDKGVTIKRYLY